MRRSLFTPLNLCLALLIGTLYYTLTEPARPAEPSRSPMALLDRLLVRAGLGIQQVSIEGHRFTSDDDIWDAAWLDEPQSLVGFDTFAAENRIRNLPWIASARIVRRPPDGLDIEVSERLPFAVWRREGPSKAAAVGVARAHLIDASGRVLAPVGTRQGQGQGQGQGLPVVVGDGAAGAASSLMTLLKGYPEVRERLDTAVRVGGQRWTLRLTGGFELLLPADNPAEALDRLIGLASRHRLFERDLVLIDLRAPGKLSVRTAQHLLRPHKPEQRPGRASAGRTAEAGEPAG